MHGGQPEDVGLAGPCAAVRAVAPFGAVQPVVLRVSQNVFCHVIECVMCVSQNVFCHVIECVLLLESITYRRMSQTLFV